MRMVLFSRKFEFRAVTAVTEQALTRAMPSLRGNSISHTCLEHLEAFLCAPLQPQNDQQQCCEQEKPDQLRVVVPSELLLLEPDAKFFEQLLVSDQG